MSSQVSEKSVSTEEDLVSLTIDGKRISVPKGTTLYHAAKQIGVDVPIFCYHDRMPPLGACRMCLVEVEKMPKLATSCTQLAGEDMVVHTQSESAKKGRESIIEFLLINHPLDCPICDRGGECPLQENTLKAGLGVSRFIEDKRLFQKRVPLGPVLMLDRERCIACARCTRFGEIVAGDNALKLLERGYRTEVGTPNGEPVESKFIGNTIMICPVGALTSQVYRFRSRPWDNDSVDSICTLCSVGCNLTLDSRDGEIVRTRVNENREVNDIWLCDKGWFGYEFAYNENRLTTPLVRKNGNLEEASWDEALELVASKLKEAKTGQKAAGFGGSPLTVEENYLFQKLMREGVGTPHVDYRVGSLIQSLEEEAIPAGTEINLGECEELDFALVLGADLTEEFPVLWLRLKQGINHGAKVYTAGHFETEMAPHVEGSFLHKPGKELESLAHFEKEIMTRLNQEAKGAIFVGGQYLNTPQRRQILSRLLQWRAQFKNLSLNVLEGTANEKGARFAGMHPETGPNGTKPDQTGLHFNEVLNLAAQDGWDLLFVAGADPATQVSSQLWEQVRAKTNFVVVQDLFLTKTALEADVVLPTLSFIEKGGKVINIEGRIQQLQPGKEVPEGVLSDAEIFTLLGQKLGVDLSLDKTFVKALESERLKISIPSQLDEGKSSVEAAHPQEALLLSVSKKLFDHGVRMQHSPAVENLVKEPTIWIHPEEGKKRHIQDGDTVKVSSDEGTLKGKAKVDQGIAKGTVVIPQGFLELNVHELGTNLHNGLPVKVEKC